MTSVKPREIFKVKFKWQNRERMTKNLNQQRKIHKCRLVNLNVEQDNFA
jgi:hypothetical protein